MAIATARSTPAADFAWEWVDGDLFWMPQDAVIESDQAADRLRRFHVMQSDQADDLIDELIDAGMIGLSAASHAMLDAARALLAKLPVSIRRSIFRRGSVKVIAGESVANAHGQHFAGLTNYLSAVVAGGHQDAEQTFLHELGHMLDNVNGWQAVSSGESWLAIWRIEKSAGRVSSFAGQDREPSEYFAESFAKYFGDDTSVKLPASVQQFMANLEGESC